MNEFENTGIDRLSKFNKYLKALGCDTSQMTLGEAVSLQVEIEKVINTHGLEFDKNGIFETQTI